MIIEQTLVELVKEYDAMDSNERRADKGQAIRKNIQLIGLTAAFFGGYDAMIKLHDAAEELVGSDNSVGYYLNQIWDGIGGWWS